MLRTGDIILFRRKFKWGEPMSWFALIIRKVTGSHYNHAGVVLAGEEQQLVEGWTNGVRVVNLNKRLADSRIEVKILRPVYKELNLVQVYKDLARILTKKYDYKATLREQFLYNVFSIWKGATNESQALNRLMCWELVWYIHRKAPCIKKNEVWWKSYLNDFTNSIFNDFKEV